MDKNPDSEKGTRFLFALNAAAAQLQRSVRSEADVYRVFCDQIVKIGLSGSINLLSRDGDTMTMVVAAVPWDKIARFDGFQESLAVLQTDVDVSAFQVTARVDSIDHYSRVLEKRQPIFELDNSSYLRQLIPDQFESLLEQVIANFGRRPAIYVPLVIETSIRGVLSVSGDGLSAGDIPSVEAFANQVAVALENARLFAALQTQVTEKEQAEEELRRRAEELAALQALSLDLITVHELPVLLSKIVDKAVELLGAQGGSLYLCEPENRQVRLYVTQQDSHQYSVGTTMSFGEGAAGLVADSGKPLIIDDYRIWPGRLKVIDDVEPFSAVLTVPMIWQGEVTGILQVLDEGDVRRFNQVDQELLTLFANHASVALETTRLLEAERQRRREAEILGKGSAALTSTLDLDQLLSVILTHLEQVVPFKSASVFLLEGDYLHIVAGKGFDDESAVVGSTHPVEKDSLFLEIQSSKKSLILDNVQDEPRFQAWGGVQNIRGWLGTPLIVRGEVIGCLTLDSDRTGVFHAGHIALVETFANQAATAIEKARLFEAEIEARQRAEAMRDAAHVVSSSLSLNQVLEVVLDQLSRVVSYDSSSIILLENDSAVVKIWRGKDGQSAEKAIKSIRFDLLPEHAVGIVVQTGKPLLIEDIKNDPRWMETALSEHIRAWLGVPLILRGKVIGLFNLDRNKVGGFTEDDITLVQTFAAHAAVAIDNARLYEQAAKERRHLRLLYDLGREMASSLDYEEILNRAISLTCQVFDGVMGQAFLYIPEIERLKLCALHCRDMPEKAELMPLLEIDLGIGLAGWVARNRQPEYLRDVVQDERWYQVAGVDDGLRSVISAPILSGDRLFGVLSVLHSQSSAFSMDQLDLLQTICQEVGLALSNAERYQEVNRRLAEITLIQNLTEIFNRRLNLYVLLDEVVEQLYQRFNYPLVEIFLIRQDQIELQTYRGNSPKVKNQSLQEGIVGRVARTGEASFLPDVTQDPDYYCCSAETVAELAVPIFRDNVVIGVINIESQHSDQLTVHDSDLLQVLAGQISIALENAVLYEQVRLHAEELELTVDQRTAELTSLYELSQKIGYTVDYEDLLRLLLSYIRSAFNCELSSACLALDGYRLFFVESSRQVSNDLVHSIREQTLREIIRENLATKKLETAPLEFVQTSDFEAQSPLMERLSSLIYAPIRVGRKPIGAIVAASDHEYAFSDYQQRLLETFAHQAASAIERITALLAAEQKRVEGLVEHLPVGVILLDADHRMQIANPLARSMLSALEVDFEGGYLTRLGNFSVDELIYHYRDPLPVEIVHENHARRVYEAQARPMGQGSQQWLIMMREVTQEREIQSRVQMQDRLATVGQLAAGIAHDFNNIMAAILVYTDLLMGDPNLPKASRDRLTIIEQQVQRAASLIRQILDFSRRAVMEQSSLDILPFVKELERMLVRVMPETIHLELAYKSGSYVVKADPTRLQQVFINLAVNARDAMPEGGLLKFSLDRVHIEDQDPLPLPDMESGDWVKITVQDTGSGIPSDVIPHIFEPFFTTKPVGQGTGLGLAQVYGIVKQHGGHIDVSSTVDEGTAFMIYLPLLPDLVYEGRHTEPLAPLDGSGKVVLVVEDDQATLAALQALLEAKNYDVITARNGYEAIQLYEQSGVSITLVVSDVVMPQMDGVKLYRALMERSPEMKVLFVTGHPLEGENQALLERGDVHWLQKPFSAREFTRMVQNLMEA